MTLQPESLWNQVLPKGRRVCLECDTRPHIGIVPLKIFPIMAILTLCEIRFSFEFPAIVILGVKSTIFGLKYNRKKRIP